MQGSLQQLVKAAELQAKMVKVKGILLERLQLVLKWV